MKRGLLIGSFLLIILAACGGDASETASKAGKFGAVTIYTSPT
ncbi:MAG TPA: hypothetical protein VMW28_08195 [Pelolinea sp.]|nr:hypothetical protein [Pelolinea sp.]